MKRIFSLSFFSLILIVYVVFPKTVLASNREQVLGQDTASSIPVMSPTAEGPGLILPDSPLFILDELKQSLRLAFAITPEAKARVHAAIAGERLAELRYMLTRNNKHGIEIDLQGVSDNLEAVADALAQSQFSGHDVSKLAIAMNTDIKAKQKLLDELEAKSGGELKFQIAVAQEKILSAKLTVEDVLPQDEARKELTEDLNKIIDRETDSIQYATDRLERGVDSLSSLTGQEVAGTSTSASNERQTLKHVVKSRLEQKKAEVRKIRDALNSLRTEK